MSVHKRIRDGRLSLGMNEQQFGDAVGVSRGAVQQWEKEGGTAPTRKNQPAVAAILGITVSELMNPDDDDADADSLLMPIRTLMDAIPGHRKIVAIQAAMTLLSRFVEKNKTLPISEPKTAGASKRQAAKLQR